MSSEAGSKQHVALRVVDCRRLVEHLSDFGDLIRDRLLYKLCSSDEATDYANIKIHVQIDLVDVAEHLEQVGPIRVVCVKVKVPLVQASVSVLVT